MSHPQPKRQRKSQPSKIYLEDDDAEYQPEKSLDSSSSDTDSEGEPESTSLENTPNNSLSQENAGASGSQHSGKLKSQCKKIRRQNVGPNYKQVTKENLILLWEIAEKPNQLKKNEVSVAAQDCVNFLETMSNEDSDKWDTLFPVLRESELSSSEQFKKTGMNNMQVRYIAKLWFRPLFCYCLLAFREKNNSLQGLRKTCLSKLQNQSQKCYTKYPDSFQNKLKEIENEMSQRKQPSKNRSDNSKKPDELYWKRKEIIEFKAQRRTAQATLENLKKQVNEVEAKLEMLDSKIPETEAEYKILSEREACLTMFKHYFHSDEERNYARNLVRYAATVNDSGFTPSKILAKIIDKAKQLLDATN